MKVKELLQQINVEYTKKRIYNNYRFVNLLIQSKKLTTHLQSLKEFHGEN